MKKLNFVVLFFVVALYFCSCQQNSKNDSAKTQQTLESLKIMNHDPIGLNWNKFIIINKTDIKISRIFLYGEKNSSGTITKYVDTIKSNGYSLPTVYREGLVADRTINSNIKSVELELFNPQDTTKLDTFKFPQRVIVAEKDNNIVKLPILKLERYISDGTNLVPAYARLIFIQSNVKDANSFIIYGVEISDKADFNTN